MNVQQKNNPYISYRVSQGPVQISNAVSFQGADPARNLQVFHHHIYEFKKGLRNLVLTTEKSEKRELLENRLIKENIPYVIHQITDNKINVYFGNQACIDIVKTFDERLNKLTPEQDFMLGIMLGYDRLKQCDRYIKMKNHGLKLNNLVG